MKIKFKSALRSLGISESLIEKTADINVNIGGLVEFLVTINFNNWEDLDKAIEESIIDNRINEINTKLDSVIDSINSLKSPTAKPSYMFDKSVSKDPTVPVEEPMIIPKSIADAIPESAEVRTINSSGIHEITIKVPEPIEKRDPYLCKILDRNNKIIKEKSKSSKKLYSEMGPEIQKWIDENKPRSRSAIAKHFGCAPSTICKLLAKGVIKCTFPDISKNNARRKDRFTDYVKFSDIENSRIHKIDEIIHDSGLSNKRPNIFNKLYRKLRDIYGIVLEDNMKQIKYKYNLVPIEDYPDPSRIECIVCDDETYNIAESVLYTICEEMSD